MAHETLNPVLIGCPPAPEKFLKQFTALLREHTAVHIATMI
jgi:coenzyme F420-reducing hydrogenase gamma subunit